VTAGTADVNDHSRGLDVLRGAAAVLVVLAHARDATLRAHDLDPAGSGVVRLVLGPASLSQEALAVFFVLSGYLVGGQVLHLVRSNRFSWREYLVKRLSRLWPVLLPSLLVTFLADTLARSLSPETFRLLSGGEDGAATAACNAAFLMPTRCEPYGSNFPLWSLSYELWFYIVFAGASVAVGSLWRRRFATAGLGLAVTAGGIAAFGVDLLRLMPAWLLGALIAEAHRRTNRTGELERNRRIPRSAWGAALVLLVAAFLASNLLRPTEPLRFLLVGCATGPLVWLCASSRSYTPHPWMTFGRWIGGWSYSIYAYHRPLVVLIAILSMHWWGADPSLSVAATYAIAVLAIMVAYRLSRVTEAHTGSVRTWALRVVGGPHRKPTPLN
jgi:peptidoglycan/LPS O-acetylase OafA/YrhL